ncbi:Glucose--fructose oxidoreductase precursor [Planctomycetes bacterium Pan216]|uniref:Glucose--fructose oxidoreductase n=1 Tax=Kolteria novifilia TaxID=2527975 RepID=A0A518BCD7_9BACT|nr:Glucose--fructose oxidoreductase precursor [Planctomycetes bacterium Pan216]
MAKYRVVGINFDHMHIGDNLRMAFEHPACEIVGVCDETPSRMKDAIAQFSLPQDRVFTDVAACMEAADPDLILLCPATAAHGDWTERLAPYGKPILMEKPFAASLEEADRMVAACQRHGAKLAINWPMVWYPSHRTAKRLVDEGTIGRVLEVHYYDGNRGPLWHTADKIERTADEVEREKPSSWFYQRSAGGGSLLDYLGYGVTLGTWFLGGAKPIEVVAMADRPDGLEVDEHSVTIARYAFGLSKFETRWGTFTDPWTHQPQPKCGFVLVGTDGTISSFDKEATIRVQTADHPEGREVAVDSLETPHQNPVQYLIDCLERDVPVEGPLSPELSRIGQQIVDTAVRSAEEGRVLPLMG